MYREPTSTGYLLELLHHHLQSDWPGGLTNWRKQLGDALETWDVSLTQRLLVELAHQELDIRGQAHLHMRRGGLLARQEQWSEALDKLETTEKLFAQTEDVVGHRWVLLTQGNPYSNQSDWGKAHAAYRQAATLFQEQEDVYSNKVIYAARPLPGATGASHCKSCDAPMRHWSPTSKAWPSTANWATGTAPVPR